jgi:hypothetical protein
MFVGASSNIRLCHTLQVRLARCLFGLRLLTEVRAATWDRPPAPEEDGYAEFETAYAAFLRGRQVKLPKLSAAQLKELEQPRKGAFKPFNKQPDYIRAGQLMGFQTEGINWMY